MAATVKESEESANRLAAELDRKLGSAFKPLLKDAPDRVTKLSDLLFYRRLLSRRPRIAATWYWTFMLVFAGMSIFVLGIIVRVKLGSE